MTGTRHTGEGLDPRRRKLLFRSWHRGMRENDLILGGFADASIAALTDGELDQYEDLLNLTDTELLPWLTASNLDVPPQHAEIINKILAFRQSVRF